MYSYLRAINLPASLPHSHTRTLALSIKYTSSYPGHMSLYLVIPADLPLVN